MKRFFVFVALFLQVVFINAQNTTYDGCEVSYEKLKSALYYAAPHHYLSAFVNLDYSLPDLLLQFFLTDMLNVGHHDDNCKWISNRHWQEEYRPYILIGNDIQYLQVHYYLKPTVDVPISSIKNNCDIIEKCEILGTPDLVLRLFQTYWGDHVIIGGQRTGELAHIDFMGDHVALFAVSNNLYKIIITDNGQSFDYKLNFGK